MTPGPTLQKSFIFRFQVMHLSFGVLKIVFSGVVLAQLSKTRSKVCASALSCSSEDFTFALVHDAQMNRIVEAFASVTSHSCGTTDCMDMAEEQ